MSSPWLLLAALIAGGVETGEARFVPTAAEADVPPLYRLPASTYRFEHEPILDEAKFTVAKVRFPSPIVTKYEVNNTVHGEYFQPKVPGKRPAVVVLHILGADFALARYYATRLASEGVGALFMKLPFYGERRPAGKPQRFLSNDVDETRLAMQQAVCDVRRAGSWLSERVEVDPERIGVTGISLGGITSALVLAVDPAFERSVTILAGGNLDEILWTMDEGGADRWRREWLAAGRTTADLKGFTKDFDPITYADRLKGKKLLMMAGNVDEVVPPASARQLWDAAGRPPIRWFDCGHYSSAGIMLPAFREAVAFLKQPRGATWNEAGGSVVGPARQKD